MEKSRSSLCETCSITSLGHMKPKSEKMAYEVDVMLYMHEPPVLDVA